MYVLLFLLASAFASEQQSMLRFIILGDWGVGGTTGAYKTVATSPKEDLRRGGAAPDIQLNGDGGEAGGASNGNAGSGGGGGGGGGKNGGGGGGGNNKKFYQLEVAAAMNQFASSASDPPQFVLALGDNFYDNGVKSATDEAWDYLWKNVYITPYSSLNIPWYVTPGNHDYGGSVQAQIDRSNAHADDDIWMMPATNFTQRFIVGEGDDEFSVAILFIDTQTLAPYSNNCCNEKSGLSSEEIQNRIVDQLTRIKASLDDLQANPVDWTIAVGHYPIYSAGDHGDNSELTSTLIPLFQAYHVPIYMCGHDHISEHLTYQNMEFFVAGAGAKTDKIKGDSSATLNWYGAGYAAFAYVDLTKTDFTINYVNINNTLVYSHTVQRNMSAAAVVHSSAPSYKPTRRVRTAAPTLDGLLPLPETNSNHDNSVVSRETVALSLGGVVIAAILVLLFWKVFYGKKSEKKQVPNKQASSGGNGLLHQAISKDSFHAYGFIAPPPTPNSVSKGRKKHKPKKSQTTIATAPVPVTTSTHRYDEENEDDSNINPIMMVPLGRSSRKQHRPATQPPSTHLHRRAVTDYQQINTKEDHSAHDVDSISSPTGKGRESKPIKGKSHRRNKAVPLTPIMTPTSGAEPDEAEDLTEELFTFHSPLSPDSPRSEDNIAEGVDTRRRSTSPHHHRRAFTAMV